MKKKISKNYPENIESAVKYNSKFWTNQSVTGLEEIVSKLGVRKDKNELENLYNGYDTNISELFEFNSLDLSNDKDIDELYNFLKKEYVRTYDGDFLLNIQKNI